MGRRRSRLEVIAKTGKDGPKGFLFETDNLKPAVFVGLSHKDNLWMAGSIRIRDVDRSPSRCHVGVCIRHFERGLAEYGSVRIRVDEYNDAADLNMLAVNPRVVRRRDQPTGGSKDNEGDVSGRIGWQPKASQLSGQDITNRRRRHPFLATLELLLRLIALVVG